MNKCLIPTALLCSITALTAPARAQEDVADVASEDLRAGGNDMMRYFLIGAAEQPPAGGYKLLLVLPGGNGSADFLPFVKRIYNNALSDEFIVAQLVAPQWSPDQAAQVVWPTRKLKWKGMEFPTEDFVEAVIADVVERRPVDKSRIFTLGWSSGGPPCYAASLRKDTPITGTFVAMSVFKKKQLPGLGRAKGRPYFLLHSQEDFIPISMAEEAEAVLTKKGAKVKLKRYSGGHGWHGDVYGNLREGIRWLEDNQ